MGWIRSLRDFHVSARFGLYFNVSCLLFVSALWGAATVTGWVHSVVFISHVSMLALVLSCLGAIFASRVEVKQEADANVAEVLTLLHAWRKEGVIPPEAVEQAEHTAEEGAA